MRATTLAVVAAVAVAIVPTATAQPLGSFTWQLQPFCNAVTFNVVQTGAVYTLDGSDNQCGGANPRAPLVGTAAINPNGSVVFGMNIVTNPSAAPVHVQATIVLPGPNGTWVDSLGNSGTFVFGGNIAASPRPATTGLAGALLTVTGAGTVGGALTAGSVSSTGSGTFDSLTIAGPLTAGGILMADVVSNSTQPTLTLRRARGVPGAELPVIDSTNIGTIFFGGLVGSANTNAASISAFASENWSATAHGSRLVFSTVANGTTAFVGRMRILDSGAVGIGTAAPDQLLTVNGNASKVGGGSWSTFSDERLKDMHGAFRRGLADVLKLEPIRYEYKAGNPLGLRGAGEYVGFSAQAVRAVIPEAVSESASGYLQVNADPILWTMLNALKELKTENDDLRARLAALEAAIKKP